MLHCGENEFYKEIELTGAVSESWGKRTPKTIKQLTNDMNIALINDV